MGKRKFAVGDTVRIVTGPYKGKSGPIVGNRHYGGEFYYVIELVELVLPLRYIFQARQLERMEV